jgi:hypothetical protein
VSVPCRPTSPTDSHAAPSPFSAWPRTEPSPPFPSFLCPSLSSSSPPPPPPPMCPPHRLLPPETLPLRRFLSKCLRRLPSLVSWATHPLPFQFDPHLSLAFLPRSCRSPSRPRRSLELCRRPKISSPPPHRATARVSSATDHLARRPPCGPCKLTSSTLPSASVPPRHHARTATQRRG